MPRSALRPPAARMVASRALGELCRLLRGRGRIYRPQRPVLSPLPPTWVAGAFRSEIECVGSA